MAVFVDQVFGRETELESLAGFLKSLEEGPAALLIEGEAGIGKTTLWKAGLEAALARSVRALSCRPAEVEAELPFAALGDLLEDALEDVVPLLPEPQARALEVALLRAEPGPTPADQRAVSVAVLNTVRTLARSAPVLLCIDDVAWLDRPSARVLAFALRRLDNEAVRLIAAVRLEQRTASPLQLERLFPEAQLQRLRVGPLDVEALDHVLRQHLGQSFLRPTLVQLHRTARGNPFFALELGRALLDRGGSLAPGDPLPVPDNLRDLLGSRLGRLPRSARRALLIVAALSHPRVEIVDAVLGPKQNGPELLAKAAQAGIVELDRGRIRFTHPLLASAVYFDASPEQRRRLHRRLGTVLADPDERAWHLAVGSERPDSQIATALDDAARRAHERAAPEVAAALLEHARRLTPRDSRHERARRGLEATDYHLQAGDTVRARLLLEEIVAEWGASPTRARALHRLAKVRFREESYPAGQELLRRSLEEAGDDASLKAAIHVDLTLSLQQSGELQEATAHALAGLELAERLDEPALLARALINVAVAEFQLGRGFRTDVMERAAGLMEHVERELHQEYPSFLHPSMVWAVMLKWADEFEPARHQLEALRKQALERHDEASLPPILFQLGELECWCGNWELAARYAHEGHKASLQSGQAAMEVAALYVAALVDAHRGNIDSARAGAERALAIALEINDHRFLIRSLAVLGFVDLSLGDHDGAHRRLGRAADLVEAAGYGEPGVFRFVPDEIEALLALGEIERVEKLVAQLEERGRTLDRPWARATGARGRALLSMSRGDAAGALRSAQDALTSHERLQQPFEFGRTLLVLGAIQRRRKQKRLAREALGQALEIFDRLGAALWAERARAELARIGGRAPAPRDLTPTEARIAELVVAGHTNRELADTLFMSVKSVERHLTHIYRKLDVRSRRELARTIGTKTTSHAP